MAGDHVARARRRPADGIVLWPGRRERRKLDALPFIAYRGCTRGIKSNVIPLHQIVVCPWKEDKNSITKIARDNVACARCGPADSVVMRSAEDAYAIVLAYVG